MGRNINSENRILILSNGCFSDTDSNGRTLAKLFQNYNNANLAQFFVYGNPDFTVCDRYYKVTDRDALESLLRWKETGGVVECPIKLSSEAVISTNASFKKVKKTPLSMLLREFAWLVGRWNGRGLKQWIEKFNPEAVFVSLGDNVFLSRLAIQIAKKYSIPVYAYSTENYCFKNYNYLTKRQSLLYKIFYLWMNKAFKKLEKYVKLGIFNTPMLTEAYDKKYNYPCTCVFSPSDIDFVKNIEVAHSPIVAYLGNLGVGRHKALVELANVLGEVMPGVKLDVYGKLPESIEDAKLITSCDHICYKGFVSYIDVVRHIHESTLLVHTELDDGFYSKDLKFAFSTKIADSVCSGTPLLIYARRDLAETDFLIRNQCAFVADSKDELRQELVKALTDKEAREVVVQNAKEVRNSYFTYVNGLKDLIRLNNDKHRMKVLQVNCVYKNGSTGKIIYDTHNELKQRGIQSVVCYGRGQKISEANVYKTSSEIFSKFNALRSRLTGLQYNGSFFATNKLINIIKNEKPDVVHLHCINGWIGYN
ncbi:MAG: glycosyltransferase family protein [Proteocatella sp.]